jgi:hypothetical protein
MVTGTEIYIDQILELGPAIRDAIRTHDVVFLKGVQAMESTIWNKVRGAESVISTIITNAADEVDSSNPEKDRASKIKTIIMDKVSEDWQGISKENILDALKELKRLDLVDIEFVDDTDRYGNPVKYPHAVSLRPIWDDIIEEIRSGGGDFYIFGSSIGKLIGLSIAGRKPDARGRYTYGLGSWRPVSRTLQKVGPDGRISKEEMKEIFISTTQHGKRKFYELRQRDKAKAPEIRFIVDDSGEFITINRDAILAYELIRERAMERTLGRDRKRGK